MSAMALAAGLTALRVAGLTAAAFLFRADLLLPQTRDGTEAGAQGEVTMNREITNSIGMRLVLIPAGHFVMGETGKMGAIAFTPDRHPSERGDFDEKPLHKVTITRPFYMGVHEVTNAEYEQFDPDHRKLRGKPALRVAGKLGFSKEDNEAVVFVSWNDATAFCRWLSEKEGVASLMPYRLPTEAEWEYACKAGTTTTFYTGNALPPNYWKNNDLPGVWHNGPQWFPRGGRAAPPNINLAGGYAPPNDWGLCEMHGNVEEWCYDWYGPYEAADQVDPVGRADGDFRVTRGGSHSTDLYYLRSANRLGTLPEDKHWLIGFRVVQSPLQATPPLPPVKYACQQDVNQHPAYDLTKGPNPTVPYFKGPERFARFPESDEGPVYRNTNHDTGLAACPNGDVLAIWYSGMEEASRDLGVVASRRRPATDECEDASIFYNVPERNCTAPMIFTDPKTGTMYHFQGVAAQATWGNLALVMRTSRDNGATWSKGRLIGPEHGRFDDRRADHMPAFSAFRASDDSLIFVSDAGGGSVIYRSTDEGQTWPEPTDRASLIRGIHAGCIELRDEKGKSTVQPALGRTVDKPNGVLMAMGRGGGFQTAEGRKMAVSISHDWGKTWSYSASEFPDIGTNQRIVLMRLREGPILLLSFCGNVRYKNLATQSQWGNWGTGKPFAVKDAAGATREINGLFVALSYDEGKSWPVKRVVTGKSTVQPALGRTVDKGALHTIQTLYHRLSEMDETHGEIMGYCSGCQTPDGVIHVISSVYEYAFNLKWIETPMPAAGSPAAVIRADKRMGPAPLSVAFDGGEATGQGSDVARWHWDFGDGAAADGKTTSHAYAKPGVYTAVLTVTDANGRTDTDAVAVYVREQSPDTKKPGYAPPVRRNGAPVGEVWNAVTEVTLSLETDKFATCKYATRPDVPYDEMPGLFDTTGGTRHSTTVRRLLPGYSYTFYVKAKDSEGLPALRVGHANADDFTIRFVISPESSDKFFFHLEVPVTAAALTPPMALQPDEGARHTTAGKYIVTTENEKGTATYKVAVPKQGDYIIWARVLGPDSSQDSFYVSADGGPEDTFDIVLGPYYGVWHWAVVNGRAGRENIVLYPRKFSFAAGEHTIVFRGREANTRLDRLIITDDPDYVPQER